MMQHTFIPYFTTFSYFIDINYVFKIRIVITISFIYVLRSNVLHGDL